MKQLAPNAEKIFWFNAFLGTLFLFIFLSIPFFVVAFTLAMEGTFVPMGLFFPYLMIVAIVVIVVPMLYAGAAYRNFSYQLTDRVIEIKRGIWWKKTVSIPYARVQNIDILEGPIARMHHVVIVQIQTAGISGVAVVEGSLPGVLPEEAQKLKDEILAHVAEAKQGI